MSLEFEDRIETNALAAMDEDNDKDLVQVNLIQDENSYDGYYKRRIYNQISPSPGALKDTGGFNLIPVRIERVERSMVGCADEVENYMIKNWEDYHRVEDVMFVQTEMVTYAFVYKNNDEFTVFMAAAGKEDKGFTDVKVSADSDIRIDSLIDGTMDIEKTLSDVFDLLQNDSE